MISYDTASIESGDRLEIFMMPDAIVGIVVFYQ